MNFYAFDVRWETRGLKRFAILIFSGNFEVSHTA
jgi:hypothetical protein